MWIPFCSTLALGNDGSQGLPENDGPQGPPDIAISCAKEGKYTGEKLRSSRWIGLRITLQLLSNPSIGKLHLITA